MGHDLAVSQPHGRRSRSSCTLRIPQALISSFLFSRVFQNPWDWVCKLFRGDSTDSPDHCDAPPPTTEPQDGEFEEGRFHPQQRSVGRAHQLAAAYSSQPHPVVSVEFSSRTGTLYRQSTASLSVGRNILGHSSKFLKTVD